MASDISFSKLMEKERNRRLYKLELRWVEQKPTQTIPAIPKRFMIWELETVLFNKMDEIDTLVERFKKNKDLIFSKHLEKK